jgi:hypothetical protein
MSLDGNFEVIVEGGCVKKRVVQRGMYIPAQYLLQNREKLRKTLILFICGRNRNTVRLLFCPVLPNIRKMIAFSNVGLLVFL